MADDHPDEKAAKIVPDYQSVPKQAGGPSFISKVVGRLSRPMPMGYYLLLAFLIPVLAKVFITIVAIVIHLFR